MSFDDLLKNINKRYGGDCLVKASESTKLQKRKRVETGILSFDIALGGGVPFGSIMTLKGEYSSGKSALAHRISAAYQRQCRNCESPMVDWQEHIQDGAHIQCCKNPERMRVIWFDAEGSYQNDWATKLGMFPSHTYVMRTEYAEQGVDVADMSIRSGECDILVIDSVAHLTPSVEIEESTEKWQMGSMAKLMNKAMRKFLSAQHAVELEGKRPPTIILINQIRHKIGVVYGSPETSPGGKGIDFTSHIICKVKRKGYVEETKGGVPLGQNIEVLVQKNKTAPPQRTAIFSLFFKDTENYLCGASNIAEQLIHFAEYWGLIEKKGSWYIFDEDRRFQGAKNAGNALLNDDTLLAELKEKVLQKEVGWLSGQ